MVRLLEIVLGIAIALMICASVCCKPYATKSVVYPVQKVDTSIVCDSLTTDAQVYYCTGLEY